MVTAPITATAATITLTAGSAPRQLGGAFSSSGTPSRVAIAWRTWSASSRRSSPGITGSR